MWGMILAYKLLKYFFSYLGVFLLAPWLSSLIRASYRTLSAKQIFWHMNFTCDLFAVQSCGAGLWALFIDPVFQADQVYSQQKWSWFQCLIAAGIFLLENVVVHVSNIVFRIFDVFLVVHHLLSFGGLLDLITNIKSGHYLPLMGLLLDMSTPSFCIFWILLRTGYANTFLWKANQWVLTHMQHCRMVLTYHMWWVCISNWNDVLKNLGLPYFIVFFMGFCTLTLILNPYWTYKSTWQLFGPVDWNFSFFTALFGSSRKLNSETFGKKRI